MKKTLILASLLLSACSTPNVEVPIEDEVFEMGTLFYDGGQDLEDRVYYEDAEMLLGDLGGEIYLPTDWQENYVIGSLYRYDENNWAVDFNLVSGESTYTYTAYLQVEHLYLIDSEKSFEKNGITYEVYGRDAADVESDLVLVEL